MADNSNPFASAADNSSYDDDFPLRDALEVLEQVPVSGNNPFATENQDGEADLQPVRIKRAKSAYKSRGTALLLLFITGLLGGHNYYVGRYSAGLGQLAISVLFYHFDQGLFSIVLFIAQFIWLASDFFAICRRDLGNLQD